MPEDSLAKREGSSPSQKRSLLTRIPHPFRGPVEAIQDRSRLLSDNQHAYELLGGISSRLSEVLDSPSFRQGERDFQKIRRTGFRDRVLRDFNGALFKAPEPGMMYIVEVDRDENDQAQHVKIFKGPPSVVGNIGMNVSNYWEVFLAKDPKEVGVIVKGEEYLGADNPLLAASVRDKETFVEVRRVFDKEQRSSSIVRPVFPPPRFTSITSFALDPIRKGIIGPVGDVQVVRFDHNSSHLVVRGIGKLPIETLEEGRRFTIDEENDTIIFTAKDGFFTPYVNPVTGETTKPSWQVNLQVAKGWINGIEVIKTIRKETGAFLAAVNQANEKAQGKLNTEEQRLSLGDSSPLLSDS